MVGLRGGRWKRKGCIPNLGLLQCLEHFQKVDVGVGVLVGGSGSGGQKAVLSSALVQTLDLRLEAWTKLHNIFSNYTLAYQCIICVCFLLAFLTKHDCCFFEVSLSWKR